MGLSCTLKIQRYWPKMRIILNTRLFNASRWERLISTCETLHGLKKYKIMGLSGRVKFEESFFSISIRYTTDRWTNIGRRLVPWLCIASRSVKDYDEMQSTGENTRGPTPDTTISFYTVNYRMFTKKLPTFYTMLMINGAEIRQDSTQHPETITCLTTFTWSSSAQWHL